MNGPPGRVLGQAWVLRVRGGCKSPAVSGRGQDLWELCASD